MDEEEQVVPALEEETEEELILDLTPDDIEPEESVEDVRARLAKAEELANNYKIRAEKAEKALPKEKKESKVEAKEPTLSTTDLYALMNSKVPEEDIEDIREYATLKNISVAEALKSSVVKTILADKAEQRATAEATSTGTMRRSTGKVSGEVLLEKANKGQMPDSDAELAALFKARKGLS